jgi:hypothetical protein
MSTILSLSYSRHPDYARGSDQPEIAPEIRSDVRSFRGLRAICGKTPLTTIVRVECANGVTHNVPDRGSRSTLTRQAMRRSHRFRLVFQNRGQRLRRRLCMERPPRGHQFREHCTQRERRSCSSRRSCTSPHERTRGSDTTLTIGAPPSLLQVTHGERPAPFQLYVRLARASLKGRMWNLTMAAGCREFDRAG